jgi:pimeloyl-ACP methyl ester carboxylesterase
MIDSSESCRTTHDVLLQRQYRGLSARCVVSALFSLALTAALAGTSVDAKAAQLPQGVSQETAVLGGSTLDVFTYRPAHCRISSLLVVFHGLHRHAPGYRDYARAVGDANCMLVVAPLFDEQRFPVWRYQLGGIVERHAVQDPRHWTGNLVLELVDWVRQREGHSLDYFLIGHSAGAQFLSRVAAFVPTEARRIVLANPSTYVAPSLRTAAPFGLGGLYTGTAQREVLRNYLAQPVTIFLGEADLGDKDLNQTPAAMAQGTTRLERGRNIYQQGRALAAAQHWAFNWRLVELPGVGHSARKMLSSEQTLVALRP